MGLGVGALAHSDFTEGKSELGLLPAGRSEGTGAWELCFRNVRM